MCIRDRSATPANTTADCNNIPAAATITASSSCIANVNVNFVENIIPGACENSFTIERTWSTDAGCGNGVSHTQLIEVSDTQAPILAGIPADLTVDCDAAPAPATPTASDNCDANVDITFNESVAQNGCETIITRTWTATDNCGNATDASQTITVNMAGTLSFNGMPSDITVECNDIPAIADIVALDACSGAQVNADFIENIIPGTCANSFTIERTWTATSPCGTSISQTQTIIVQDSTNPVLVGVPSDLGVGCGACLLYTSPSPRDRTRSRMPSSA